MPLPQGRISCNGEGTCGENHSEQAARLGPAPADCLKQVVAEIKKFEPDVRVPMHGSGLNFTMEAQAQMPNSVISTSTGSKLIFSA